jgi:hypothetical protein
MMVHFEILILRSYFTANELAAHPSAKIAAIPYPLFHHCSQQKTRPRKSATSTVETDGCMARFARRVQPIKQLRKVTNQKTILERSVILNSI